MKITRCKLSNKVQHRLLEFFILEVTARSAADILGIGSVNILSHIYWEALTQFPSMPRLLVTDFSFE